MDEEQNFEDVLRAYGQRQRFRQRLQHEHATLPTDRPAVPLRTNRNVTRWWRRHRQTLAVAAVVAIFTTFGTILTYRSYQTGQQQEQQYSLLRRDVQAIQRSQFELIKNLNGRGQVLQRNPGQVAGSGFLLTSDGYMVTNNHIVQDADSVYVVNASGLVHKARVIYTDRQMDLALLELRDDTAFRALPTLPYSFETRPADLGERVFTLGYPREDVVYGEGYLSSQTGFRGDTLAYQVSIGVNPGNSGGPLLNERGAVIGIVNAKANFTEGATFAVKTGALQKLIATLPADSLRERGLALNRKNTLTRLPRKEQIKRLQDYVYQVKVFKH